MTHELLSELHLAKAAARRAGAIVLRHFGSAMAVRYKDPDQPLTAADLEADALLHDVLRAARPEYGWLSEETEDRPDRLERDRVWIVDPIDGTRSFIAGRPEFSISLGLAEAGAALVGVVYNPARDELFYAARGRGAFMETGTGTRALMVSARGPQDDVAMLASRSEIAAGVLGPVAGAWRLSGVGSTAYKLACVAAGRGDVFLSRSPKKEWDICAGALIITEAGGHITDVNGTIPGFNREDPHVDGVLAANRALHEAVIRRIGKLARAAGRHAVEKAG
jgi:myo-inositol-1(or 4)-monophosphatase